MNSSIDVEDFVTRIWRVHIDPSRAKDYDRFVLERSKPMFRVLPGLVNALFLGRGDERLVVSTWESQVAVDELSDNTLYRETSADLQTSGILASEPSLAVFRVDLIITRRIGRSCRLNQEGSGPRDWR